MQVRIDTHRLDDGWSWVARLECGILAAHGSGRGMRTRAAALVAAAAWAEEEEHRLVHEECWPGRAAA